MKLPAKNRVLRRLALVLLAFTLLALLLAIIRWQATLAYFGNYLIYSEPTQTADLIVVLAGNFYGSRVLKSAELVSHGYAPKVLISGTPYQGRPEGELAITFLAKQGYRTDYFESFGHHARSTIEEAIALRPELVRRGVKRVILITSSYHSRRASVVMRLICSDIHFFSVPAPDPHYNADRWWQDKSSRRLFFAEWSKIIGSLFLAYPEYLLKR
jgi:uncharacterized SAM-binding protein YcdF (DUF218 family)